MDFSHKQLIILSQICILILSTTRTLAIDDVNLRNHRNGILSLKDVADSWIGYPKSPYTSFSVTVSPATYPTTNSTPAPPQNPTKKPKRKKYKKSSNNKRRYDSYDDSSYKEDQKSRENYAFRDFDDYDYDGPIDSSYSKAYPPSPYILRSSGAASSPKSAMVNPSISTNSQTVRAIYAEPKVATYVIPNSKRYVVQRVKAEMAYVPPVSVPPSPSMYTSASNSGMRRLDPMDYDDNGGGSYLNLGPQDSFPPRPVMAKISQPGQRQPCHGPECHQHHKGLVRFYWRRVVYPRNGRRRLRRPGRGRTRRRRFRDGGRSPSDQKDIYFPDDDNNGDEEDTANEEGNTYENNEEDEEEEEEENEDNDENDSSRRNVWQPGKGYGHDLNEGYNYDDQDKRVYRDKRYVYRNNRKRRRGAF